MSLFYQPEIISGNLFLDPEESRHCVKVLRHKTGDTIRVLDGQGGVYDTRIVEDNQKRCTFEMVEAHISEKPSHHIHIAIAPTKNLDRMEWFIEKATEIGVQEISFVVCNNSERRVLKLDRLERKAISAMKQSQNLHLPRLNEVTKLKPFITSLKDHDKFIAYVDFNNPLTLTKEAVKGRRYCVLIGPEGDFTEEELVLSENNNFKKVSLGNSRLRTETAGFTACHILNLINDR